jgi:hypothetical protein
MASDPEKKSFIHAACTPEEKKDWVRAAIRVNLKLTAWIVRTLNEKVRSSRPKDD